ncbi:S9 family peptidase [Lapillicoccus jejuensis]|uniref:Oligopeptidase B n=1 Tax=Lapillicoccus jejuensis TaxID=402171 RepID=A0A542E6Q1_9MICO|nr:S9 family peptidase [Lapillicoccus jejuensis]TQJ11012.1 oligopeptidase B [Lapillicoccus jejuensis]
MPLPEPPVAPARPHTRTVHDDAVEDPYAWMADKEDPALRAYLEAENAYAAQVTGRATPLAEEIFGEIKRRTQETDLSVPVRHDGWWYYSRTVEGQQYAVHARVAVADSPQRPALEGDAPPAGEQVLLDENAEAAGHEFFSVGSSDVSPDGRLIAFSTDTAGDERFALTVRDLDSGRVLDTAVSDIGYGLAWSLDGRHLLYTRVDDAWRPFQVWRHEIGAPADTDVLVVQEDDVRFTLGLGTSRDDRWVVVAAGSSTTNEVRLLDAADVTGEPVLVAARVPGVEYDVEPLGDELLVVHNRDRRNFEVARARVEDGRVGAWEPLGVTSEDEYVVGVDAFAGFAVVSLRTGGLTALRLLPRDPAAPTGFGAAHDLAFDEPVRTVGLGDNPDPASTTLLLGYTSLVTPSSVLEHDVATGESTLVKATPVLGGFDPADYVQRREWATAADGTKVPISIVHRRDTPLDGTAPGLLYGYGSYGICLDPWFSVARLSLLDRGFVWAVAHIRGGSEMGRPWYDDGKLAAKEHTFSDFVACADHLLDLGLVDRRRLVAEGGSAGGLLMGAVVNLAADRFRAVHLQVPFVDALTTMLDPTLPLTAGEWEEWGNPIESAEDYARMKGWSPYENLAAEPGGHPLPALLVTTSFNDTRVLVTEPAKYVARLRALGAGEREDAPIVFRTELVAGHAGVSGRYDAWKQTAREWAWLVTVATDPLPEAAAAG